MAEATSVELEWAFLTLFCAKGEGTVRDVKRVAGAGWTAMISSQHAVCDPSILALAKEIDKLRPVHVPYPSDSEIDAAESKYLLAAQLLSRSVGETADVVNSLMESDRKTIKKLQSFVLKAENDQQIVAKLHQMLQIPMFARTLIKVMQDNVGLPDADESDEG